MMTTRLVAPCSLTLALLLPPSIRGQSKSGQNTDSTPTTLAPFEVQSDRARDGHYKADRSRSATRTDTALLDVPQSISVVTAEQIRDQQMRSLEHAVRYVPGVNSHQGENNRDQIIFRGNNSSADFFLNGVRDDVQYFRDLYNLDRVEVLRGANAMIFGRGGGGGVINRVLKEAEFSPVRELTLQAGSFNFKRASLDLNQPLSDRASTRLNAMHENSGSFRRFVRLHRRGLNPTITLRNAGRTRVLVGFEDLRDHRTADRGVTSFAGRPADVARETFYGDPNQSIARADVQLATIQVEHLAGDLAIRSRAMAGSYQRFYQNFVPGAASTTRTTVLLSAYNNATERRNVFNQTDLNWTTRTGGVRHLLLTGFELGRQATENFRQTGYFNNATTSLSVAYRNPVTATPVTWRQAVTDADNGLVATVAGLYVQDQVEFSRHWQAIAGLRADSFELRYRNRRTGDTLTRRDAVISPRAGLIYKPTAIVSVYLSSSVSFLPASGDQFSSLTNVTQQMKPERFTNSEIGAKWDLPANVSLTTALYRLDRTNTRATDPTDPTRILQSGRQRSEGFELGLNGRLLPRWVLAASYAYQHARIRSATSVAAAGAVVPQVPSSMLSCWSKVQVTSRLSLGGGLVHRTQVFAAIDNAVVLPGYTDVQAAAFFTINERCLLQVNVENALDRTYHLNADSNTNISPGSPRAIRLGFQARL